MQAPSEFTRMFDTDLARSEGLTAPAPAAPLPQGGAATGAFSRHSMQAPPAGSGPSEFTQMFAAHPPAVAKAPAATPAPPAAKAERSYLPLILILAGLFLVAIVVIAVFVLMR
jgi:hypothetical protein